MISSQPSGLKPIVLLIHGAWHRPCHLDPIANSLHAHGYITYSPALPSVSDKRSTPLPLTSHAADAAVIRAIVSPLVEQGREVILFVHSYGGIPASDAVAGLARLDRQRLDLPGGVIHIVWCAAFANVEGQSLVDVVVSVGGPGTWFDVIDLPEVHGGAPAMVASMRPGMELLTFYQDIDNADGRIDAAVQQIGDHAAQTFMSKQNYSAWRDVSSTFMQTSDDRANGEEQKAMIKTILDDHKNGKGAKGVHMDVAQVEGGHTPWMRPEGLDLTVNVIRRAAGEDV